MLDRMAAFEAPRPAERKRPMRNVTLRFLSRTEGGSKVVQIPSDMKLPDVIRYHDKFLVRRDDSHYSEASMWPVLEELDG
jgi:hypothetical protein